MTTNMTHKWRTEKGLADLCFVIRRLWLVRQGGNIKVLSIFVREKECVY